MSRHLRAVRALLALLAPLAVACGGARPSAAPSPVATPTPVPSPSLVIVSVDGLRADAATTLSSVRQLADRGAYTWQAQTVMPSNTLPSHVSMLSGFLPAAHQILWNDYQPNRVIAIPTVFTYAQAAGRKTAMIAGKAKFDHFNDTGLVDSYTRCAYGDDQVAAQAVARIAGGFDLVFVHFPDVDLSGHRSGWMSSAYLERLTSVDLALARLFAALPPWATVILTADHGGHAAGHGTADRLDMTIPWVVSGPRTHRGRLLGTRVTTTDTAATAAHVLGIRLGRDVHGKPVLEAFVPGS